MQPYAPSDADDTDLWLVASSVAFLLGALMIEPTIGRVVWYYKYVEGQGLKGPLAAIVAHVHSDIMLTLSVCGSDGVIRAESSVPLVQDDSTERELGGRSYCTWMPFQKGQASKVMQPMALDTLREICRDKTQDAGIRLQAATALLAAGG